MPTFNSAQLAAFLNVLHEPAQLYDVRGNLVAENQVAQAISWPHESGDSNGDGKEIIHTVDLGEGWFLRLMTLSASSPAPVRLSGQAGVRPTMQVLLSGITHELRNPLAAILTAAGLLQDDSSVNEETAMLLGVVRNEARRMNKILTEFSLYVKPPQPQPQMFNFSQVAQATLQELTQNDTLPETLKIENRLPESLMVFADPDHMQQVLARLLQNAACALKSQNNGAITLRSYPQEDTARVVICVEDNGPGFSREESEQAFVPFYSTKAQGLGLGLSIVQGTVQAANGAIWLENRALETKSESSKEDSPSQGSRVCFALPGEPIETI
jgi:signal transduction histidine kinase